MFFMAFFSEKAFYLWFNCLYNVCDTYTVIFSLLNFSTKFRHRVTLKNFIYRQSKVRTTMYSTNNTTTIKKLLDRFHLIGHFKISPTDSKVRTTLYSIINSTTGKYCSIAFI